MALVFSLDLVPPYPTPFAACRYIALFSRSQGGRKSTPPPGSSCSAQPPAVRVLINKGCRKNDDLYLQSRFNNLVYCHGRCRIVTRTHIMLNGPTYMKNPKSPHKTRIKPTTRWVLIKKPGFFPTLLRRII